VVNHNPILDQLADYRRIKEVNASIYKKKKKKRKTLIFSTQLCVQVTKSVIAQSAAIVVMVEAESSIRG